MSENNRQAALELRQIRKSFGDNQVLKGVDVSVQEGEVLAVLGPSGSGKSTLLRCATFLERMDWGVLRFFGETAGGARRCHPQRRGRKGFSA